MGRYLSIYAACVRFSFRRAMEFRLDFFFRVGMDGLWYVMNLAFFGLLYQHTSLLAGWDEADVRLFVASLFVMDAVHMTLFSNNMWWFPTYVNRGDLDYHLLRPVSSLFFLSMRDFAVNSFLNLLMAVGILVWALASYPRALPAENVLAYALALPLGIFIHYALLMLFLIPVFWLHGGTGLRDVYYTLDRFAGRPDGLWKGWMRHVLTVIVPMALVVSYPTRALVEAEPWGYVLHVALAAGTLFVLLVLLWRAGLRAYSSASS